jgi:hypothetical protein
MPTARFTVRPVGEGRNPDPIGEPNSHLDTDGNGTEIGDLQRQAAGMPIHAEQCAQPQSERPTGRIREHWEEPCVVVDPNKGSPEKARLPAHSSPRRMTDRAAARTFVLGIKQ